MLTVPIPLRFRLVDNTPMLRMPTHPSRLRQSDVDNPNNADSVQGKVTIENTLNSLVYVFENNNLGSRLALIDRNANNFELHLPEGLITLAFYTARD